MIAVDGLQNRLKSLVRIAGSARRFAEFMEGDITAPAESGWLRGSRPYDSNISMIAEKTGVSRGWILDGKGDEIKELNKFREVLSRTVLPSVIDDSSETSRVSEDGVPYGAPEALSSFSAATIRAAIQDIYQDKKLPQAARRRKAEPYLAELTRRASSQKKA